MTDDSASPTEPKPDDVLRRMLAMKPNPKEKGGRPKPPSPESKS